MPLSALASDAAERARLSSMSAPMRAYRGAWAAGPEGKNQRRMVRDVDHRGRVAAFTSNPPL